MPRKSEPTDIEQLLKKAREGDVKAAELLVKEVQKLATEVKKRAEKTRSATLNDIRAVMELIYSKPRVGRREAERLLNTVSDLSPCEAVQVWGVYAYAQRSLGELGGAEDSLGCALALSGDCEPCIADVRRRRSKLRAAQGRYQEALADADFAVRFYRRFGPGHDLDGEGLAVSLEARGQILDFLGRQEEAVEVFAECVRILPPRKEDLYAYAVVNLGVALRGLGPERKREALDSLAPARNRFRRVTEPSVPRVKLDWLEGDLRCELKDRPERGRELLYRALGDCPGLGLEAEAVAITADVMLVLFPARARILSMLAKYRPAMGRLVRTPKLRQGLDELCRAVDAYGWHAEERLGRTIASVRRSVSDFPGVFPCLVS